MTTLSATSEITVRAADASACSLGHVTAADLIRARVLLASDGSPASDAAVRVAAALTRQRRATPSVVTVIAPASQIGLLERASPLDASGERDAESRRRLVATQLLAGGAARWPLSVVQGDAASCIVERARVTDATLVVAGLRPRASADRRFHDETILRVVRAGAHPVLAVTGDLAGLPRRILVGVDFSRASLRAARAAIAVAAPDATIYLTCVRPRPARWAERFAGHDLVVAQGIASAFNRLAQELAPPPGMQLEPVPLAGDATFELIEFARRAGIDLIAVGSHSRSAPERLRLGSVASSIVHDAGTSVLVVGPC